MKRFLKKGDGLATIVITIVLIVIVLLIVPVLKAFQASAGNNAKTTAITQTAMIDGATEKAAETGNWALSDGTELDLGLDGGGGNPV